MDGDLTLASDANLVLAVGRFQQEALAELYRRHAGAVFGLAQRLLWNRALAEEVLQDVFVRLWTKPERFDVGRGSLRAYLLSEAHGRAVDLLRAEGSRKLREEREARRASPPEHDLEREVWDLTLAEHVRAALGELPAEERQAIELAFFAGHTYREVASILNEPEGTVKSRIRAGLRRMHRALGRFGVTTSRGEL